MLGRYYLTVFLKVRLSPYCFGNFGKGIIAVMH